MKKTLLLTAVITSIFSTPGKYIDTDSQLLVIGTWKKPPHSETIGTWKNLHLDCLAAVGKNLLKVK